MAVRRKPYTNGYERFSWLPEPYHATAARNLPTALWTGWDGNLGESGPRACHAERLAMNRAPGSVARNWRRWLR
jgi:hypothetical protein